MYLRETRRTNRDGSVVAYLQLAHNERHPETGDSVAKVIHNFGRAEQVDRDALARLVSSISRFLTPEQAVSAAVGRSRGVGLAPPWWRLDVGPGLGTARDRGRDSSGRHRSPPGWGDRGAGGVRPGRAACARAGKQVGGHQVGRDPELPRVLRRRRVCGDGLPARRAEEIAGEIFGSVATLLNLDLDILFVDTTSTYWEVDVADELVDLQESVDDDGVSRPVEQGTREFGHSKDHRTDLPQVVIAMAVTRDGVPVRCWTFPGNENDQRIIRTVKKDLAVEPAPDGLGRRPWLRLGRQPGLPDPGWRVLHPRQEAALHQQRGRRRCRPAQQRFRPPHTFRQPSQLWGVFGTSRIWPL